MRMVLESSLPNPCYVRRMSWFRGTPTWVFPEEVYGGCIDGRLDGRDVGGDDGSRPLRQIVSSSY